MRRSTLLTLALVLLVASAAWTRGADQLPLERPAGSFDRSYMVHGKGQLAPAELIRTALNSAQAGRPALFGWCEYDLQVPQTGWYELLVSPTVWRYELLMDGNDYRYCLGQGAKAGNYYLTAGPHVLRVQRLLYYFGSYGPIAKLTLRPATAELTTRASVRLVSKSTVQRLGAALELEVKAGGLSHDTELVMQVREPGAGGKELARQAVKLPAGAALVTRQVQIPCDRAGLFELHFGEKDKPAADEDLPPIEYSVIDTAPMARPGGEIKKTLLQEIDCTATAPDYSNGAPSRVVHAKLGDYRESGKVGWYGHMNATEPCWFAYSVKVPQPQRQYVVEVDYPDDALRTFAIVLREAVTGSYPTAGGVDSGGEFSLSHKMQTHSLLYWAQSTDLRVVLINATDGMRAAAAKIRVYEVQGELPPLDVPLKGGRNFGNWFEEGTSFLGLYGGPDFSQAGMKDYLFTVDRWAHAVSYIGGDTLWPTFAVYQFGMYPSHYNVLFTGPHTTDVARVILLNCEKYGLGMVGEFHPEARELMWAIPEGQQNDNLLISREGQFGRRPGEGGTQPCFNPLHPRNQEWYLGMVGEFADRYQDSPAFRGVCLRLMTWVNPSLNNLHSLNWGYEDFTIALFEKETGIKIPVDRKDPQRFALRYSWLMANAREKWISWRCDKITNLYERLVKRVRAARPDLMVYTGVIAINPDAESATLISREAGIDTERLRHIDGLQLINGGNYGRRPDSRPVETRDSLLASVLTPVRTIQEQSAWLISGTYLEATEAVLPPVQLGFPATTKVTWMAAVVNPAGRHCLERWAIALAESDACYLSDGGNTYTLGQPLQREFMREYRRLPAVPFKARLEARDPVAVWETPHAGEFYFYAVNRDRYPVRLELALNGAAEVQRLTSTQATKLQNGRLVLELQPYELAGFKAPAGATIVSVQETCPPEQVEKVRTQVVELEQMAQEARQGALQDLLTPGQAAQLAKVALEARTELERGHLWRARIWIEHEMAGIYTRCNRWPALVRDNGTPEVPPGAVMAADLRQRMQNADAAKLAASETVVPDWQGLQLLVTEQKSIEISFDVPVSGRYALTVGHASGGQFGPIAVTANGQAMGVMGAPHVRAANEVTRLPALFALKTQGKMVIRFARQSGAAMAFSHMVLTPVSDDILSLRWTVAGPFAAASEQPDKALAEVFAPEKEKDLDKPLRDAAGRTLKWQRLEGFVDRIDVSGGKTPRAGNVSYALTYIYSPTDRQVRLTYGMDYWIKMWLNNQLIRDFQPHGGGAAVKGQFEYDVDLKAGWNEFLVKVASGHAGHAFWMGISNPGDLRFSATAPTAGP